MQIKLTLALRWLRRQSREMVVVVAIALLTTGCTALLMDYLLISAAQSTDVNLDINLKARPQIEKM